MNQAEKKISKSVEPIKAQVISNPFHQNTSHNVKIVQNPSVDTAPVAQTKTPTDVTPLSAADNDLIEKVWVEAVRKMSKQFEDDPFELQQHQAQLTRDYLKKRFGRDIKAS